MSNMSYCRFENTLADLSDCYENMDNSKELSVSEQRCRAKLIKMCEDIAGDYGEKE